jgi:hypothetical protein
LRNRSTNIIDPGKEDAMNYDSKRNAGSED